MKKKGSALIVAMMLIAGVGAVAFGIGRLLFIETKTATLYENGIVAYYAAESGIEEGFLRYKFDRNVMVPGDLLNGDVMRTDLSAKTVAQDHSTTIAPAVSGTNNDIKTFYDLNMGYSGTNGNAWYGNDVDKSDSLTSADLLHNDYLAGDYASLRIGVDRSAKIDLTDINLINNNNQLLLLFENVPNLPTEKCRAMAEVKIAVEEAGVTREFKELTNYSPTICAGLIGLDQNKLLGANLLSSYVYTTNADPTTNSVYYEINLQEMLTRAGYTYNQGSNVPVTLTIRPLYYNARFGLYSVGGETIPGPFTTITSRGYYGGVTRTLTANVDRQSGTLYDLFDYVIFKND